MCITIYEGRKKNASPLYERFNTVHHGFMEAFKKCASPFYDAFKNLTHDLRRSEQFASPLMSAAKISALQFMGVPNEYTQQLLIHATLPVHPRTPLPFALWP